MTPPKQKVLVYITRDGPVGVELLVFEHRNIPLAGIQVPAGSVNEGENAILAAKREVIEESGLNINTNPSFVGSYPYYRQDIDEHQIRNVFHIMTAGHDPEVWEHVVQGIGEDKDLIFKFYWIPIDEAKKTLAGDQGNYLDLISLK